MSEGAGHIRSARIAASEESWGSLGADLLACPSCGGVLLVGLNQLSCDSCRTSFPVRDGIPCFAPTDEFYDRYAVDHAPYKGSPPGLKEPVLRVLPFWSWREWRFWRRVVPSCHRLLDIGCGRGRQLFQERASEAVGFDASWRFARDCSAHYPFVAVGGLPRLPFRTGLFDVVVSSHVFGHVPSEDKELLVAEIARVLRPGGITAHIIETDSKHPAVVAAKARPEAYRRQFVEQDGHVGLELAPVALERFQRHAFRLTELRLVDAIVPSMQNFRKYLNYPDFDELPGGALLRCVDGLTARSRMANLMYEVAMGVFHQTVEQWLGDPGRAQFIMASFVKERSGAEPE